MHSSVSENIAVWQQSALSSRKRLRSVQQNSRSTNSYSGFALYCIAVYREDFVFRDKFVREYK